METRRNFLRKSAYSVPVILTLAVRPAFAQNAYTKAKGNNGVGNGLDDQPPGDPPINDGSGTGPGNPGNQKGN